MRQEIHGVRSTEGREGIKRHIHKVLTSLPVMDNNTETTRLMVFYLVDDLERMLAPC